MVAREPYIVISEPVGPFAMNQSAFACPETGEAAIVDSGCDQPLRWAEALQAELRRWHPDKWGARWGGRLAPAERDAALGAVTQVAACLTELLGRESA